MFQALNPHPRKLILKNWVSLWNMESTPLGVIWAVNYGRSVCVCDYFTQFFSTQLWEEVVDHEWQEREQHQTSCIEWQSGLGLKLRSWFILTKLINKQYWTNNNDLWVSMQCCQTSRPGSHTLQYSWCHGNTWRPTFISGSGVALGPGSLSVRRQRLIQPHTLSITVCLEICLQQREFKNQYRHVLG